MRRRRWFGGWLDRRSTKMCVRSHARPAEMSVRYGRSELLYRSPGRIAQENLRRSEDVRRKADLPRTTSGSGSGSTRQERLGGAHDRTTRAVGKLHEIHFPRSASRTVVELWCVQF